MMTSNELFYGDSDPVYVVDSPYSRRSRYDDKYYSSRSGSPGGGYYRGSSGRGRGLSDYYSDVDGLRGGDYYNRSGPDYFSRGGYSPDPYYSGSPNTGYGPAYNDTYYDSRPNDYYDYRRPSAMLIPTRIRSSGTPSPKEEEDYRVEGSHLLRGVLRRGTQRFV